MVQIVSKSSGVRRIVEHLGSAHTAAELDAGRQKIAAWQGQVVLDLAFLGPVPGRTGLVGATVVLQALGFVVGGSAPCLCPPGAG